MVNHSNTGLIPKMFCFKSKLKDNEFFELLFSFCQSVTDKRN